MIEAIIGVVLASIFLTAFLKLNMEAIKLNRANVSNFKASMYLKELIEITKDLEQSDWSELNKPICYSDPYCHPEISGNEWELVFGTESLDSDTYNRSIMITDVYRDQLVFPNEIVTIGGILDPDTKKITAEISWDEGNHSMKLETYVYDFND